MLQDRYRQVGREVRRLRLLKGLTHEDLAHEAKVSVKTISRVEKGELHEHRGSTYRKLAGPLGVTAEYLLAPIFRAPDAEPALPELQVDPADVEAVGRSPQTAQPEKPNGDDVDDEDQRQQRNAS